MADLQQADVTKKPHIYRNGKYEEVEGGYTYSPYPKIKYHANESPIQVNDAAEEDALGDDWRDSPADHGIITAPDVKEIQRQRIAEANANADWKKVLPAQSVALTEHHVSFLQAAGLSDVANIEGVYAFLAKLNSAQQSKFMADAALWKPKAKLEGKK